MITKPTVLVLGAGASIPFGFPSGRQLRQIICEKNTERWADIRNLCEQRFGPHAFHVVVDEFTVSGRYSIDAFLEHRPDLLITGKYAIAGALIPYERSNTLFDHLTLNGRWYAHLAEQLSCNRDEWTQNQLTIVTFNYDRSIEFFLRRSVQASFNISESEAATLADTVRVIHLHGKLGALAPRAHLGRPYDPLLDYTAITHGAEGIQIISEAKPESSAFIAARDALSSAERIVFLGFAYAEENLKRILPMIPNDSEISGTAYGLREAQRNEVIGYFVGRIELGASEDDALQFLESSAALRIPALE